MAKSNTETFWWSLFAMGGVVAALLIPALIFITGLAIPFINGGAVPNMEPVTYDKLYRLAANPLGRVLLFLATSLPFFHCANRFFHTSKDLGLSGARGPMALLCFGGAIVGSGTAAWLVATL